MNESNQYLEPNSSTMHRGTHSNLYILEKKTFIFIFFLYLLLLYFTRMGMEWRSLECESSFYPFNFSFFCVVLSMEWYVHVYTRTRIILYTYPVFSPFQHQLTVKQQQPPTQTLLMEIMPKLPTK